MPSPLGHALAGAIVGLTGEHLARRRQAAPHAERLVLAALVVAVLPDIDLLFMPWHRTLTHSFTAALAVTIIAAAVTRQVTGRVDLRAAAVCGAAVLSHILCDWLGEDFNAPRGIQVLWPFSDEWFISGWDVFRNTERRAVLSWATLTHNAITGAQELLLLGPPALLTWWMTRRTRRRMK